MAAGCFELPAFLLNLAEQLRVLDGKHRLGCEGFHQVHDLFAEFTWLAAPDDKRTDDLVRPEQWNHEDAAISGVGDDLLNGRWRLFFKVRDLDRRPTPCGVADSCVVQSYRLVGNCGDTLIAHPKSSAEAELLPCAAEHIDNALIRVRQLDSLRDDRLQHGVKIERRVDSLADFPERLKFANRACKFGRAHLYLLI